MQCEIFKQADASSFYRTKVSVEDDCAPTGLLVKLIP